MYHKFFIHSSVNGYLGCFHVIAIVYRVAMNNDPIVHGIKEITLFKETCVSFNFGFLRVYA